MSEPEYNSHNHRRFKTALAAAVLLIVADRIGASYNADPAPTATTSTISPTSTTTASTGGVTAQTAARSPLLGALDPTVSDSVLAQDGFKEVVIPAYWNAIEPTKGTCDLAALASVQANIIEADRVGLSPSLDIGVQATPDWVFGLDDSTRFVDQSGNEFGGASDSGNDVANAVTDKNVQHAMATYLGCLGRLSGLGSVRLGGEADNELRYPGGSFYFYDKDSQAQLPAAVRGWKPGSGTVVQATAFLETYNTALDTYGVWLARTSLQAFPSSVMLEVLLPGGGERPEQIQPAEDSLLTQMGGDDIYQGLDWQHLLPRLGAINASHRIVAYSTWADNTTSDAPADYIHSILPPGMLEGGETTGNGNTTEQGVEREYAEAKQEDWYVANDYMNQAPGPVELAQDFNKAP